MLQGDAHRADQPPAHGRVSHSERLKYEADKGLPRILGVVGRHGGVVRGSGVGVRARLRRGRLCRRCQAGVSRKRSGSWAVLRGGRAGMGLGGGSVGRPRWPRIVRISSPASIVAITDMRPPQRAQAQTSRSNTRRIKLAHVQSRSLSVRLGCSPSPGHPVSAQRFVRARDVGPGGGNGRPAAGPPVGTGSVSTPDSARLWALPRVCVATAS